MPVGRLPDAMSDWKYDIDEVGDDADDGPDDAADPEANRDAAVETLEPLEPGSPTVENAFFVALGVGATLFVFARVVMLVG